MRLRLRSTFLAALAVAAWSGPAAAQCADGSPPPCRVQTVAAATRRADPPLDERTWIVVPFDNLSGNQEIDWLRSGSVNLLYLGMSRWTDVRVIDDERVADYMREVPGAADAKQLSLNAALAVAKRAGAGRLVMGDILKLGSRTTVNAKIFDVKTGQRQRTVREETAAPDSIMPMFGKLSQKVLNIAPPPGSAVGVVGTSSIAAYQEYAQGMQALNRFELYGAQGHFTRALEIDSTFALAHSKLAVLLGWVSPGLPSIREHAEAAGRLAGSLPPREKALIEASVAFARGEYVKSCEGFRGLIRRDSTDTDAWYGLGDCLFHDMALEPVPGDSARLRWRASRSESVRAFRAALALDPTYHLAYQHIVDAYLQQSLAGRGCVGQACGTYIAVVRASGDSLLTDPLLLPRDSALHRSHMDELLRRGLRRVAMDTALKVTEVWVAANPREQRANMMRAATLLSLGRVAEAAALPRPGAAIDTSTAGATAILAQVEILIKLWRADDALRLYDSLRAHPFTLRGGANPVTIGNALVSVAPVFGQLTLFDSLIIIGSRGAPPSRLAFSRSVLRSMAGIRVDSFVPQLNAIYSEAAAAGAGALITRQLAPILLMAARTSSPSQWPQFDTTVSDSRIAAVRAIQRGDTVALRRSARALDSISRLLTNAVIPDSGMALLAAEAYLALRDSATALAMTRRWLDTTFAFTPLLVNQVTGNTQLLLPRAILLRADLAAALGSRDEARLWYGRLLAISAHADVEIQPMIERVRKSYAAVGGT